MSRRPRGSLGGRSASRGPLGAEQNRAKHRVRRGIAAHPKPRAAAVQMLPMLEAIVQAVDPFIHGLVGSRGGLRQSFAKYELFELARAAEWANEPAHNRAGNGPSPRSSRR